jgi:hemolysin D
MKVSRDSAAERQLIIRTFESEASELRFDPDPLQTRATLFLLVVLLLSMIGLSTMFTIDRVVSSQFGQVVTLRHPLVLQSLDPSIIKSIDVLEGQTVKAHDVLATLDPTFTAADVDALKMQIESLDAEIARTEAQLGPHPFVLAAMPDGTRNRYEKMQESYYNQRVQQLESHVKAADEQIAQAKATIAKLVRDAELYKQRIGVAVQVENMRSQLKADLVGSQLNLLAATDARLELVRSLESDQNSLTETQHLLASTEFTRDATIQEWRAQASQELLTARNARDNAVAQLAKAEHHRDLVRIEAPEDAIVLSVSKMSAGSVLKEGDPLFVLAPLNSPLEVEAYIAARDVGFIRAGDPVTIKLDPFQFVEHGTAKGKVLWISEGTFDTDPGTGSSIDPTGRPVPPYYKARIGVGSAELRDVPDSFRLIPGMTLTADIHVGTRSLFMYLVRGVVRSVDEAMRDP